MRMSEPERAKYRFQSKTMPLFESMLPQIIPGPILDAGCGEGRLTRSLARRYEKVTGIDFDSASVRKAKSQKYSNEVYLCGDLHNLKFDNNFFEAIFCHGVLRHCNIPSVVLGEFYRVLKNKGQFYIMDVFCEPEALSFCRTLSFFRTVKPKHYWTYNQFLKLLRHK